MTLWILDTDHLSLIQRQHPNVIQRLVSMNPDDVAITVITAEEQLRGRLNTIRQASSASQSSKLLEAYALFRETLEDLKGLSILGFSSIAHTQFFLELKQQKLRLGTQDLKIASIALSVNATVVTRNRRDFEQVPGIRLEDWTIS